MPARAKTVDSDVAMDAKSEELQVTEQTAQAQVSAFQNLESTQIFREIGAELRNRRELLSLHLGEVERNTHVKAHYLEALEKGAMDDLPSNPWHVIELRHLPRSGCGCHPPPLC
jgi:hypothetical protein